MRFISAGLREPSPAAPPVAANGTETAREPRRRVLRPKKSGEALTYAERTPLLLQLLERLQWDGAAGFARSFDDRHLRGAGPKRLTNRERARDLLTELDFYDFMARTYADEADGIATDAERAAEGGHPDHDLRGRIDGAARRESRARKQRRLSPASELRNLRLMYRAVGKQPTAADLERSLRYSAEHYAEKARRLREELGPAFLDGTDEQRQALIRKWRHRYRKDGLLTQPRDFWDSPQPRGERA